MSRYCTSAFSIAEGLLIGSLVERDKLRQRVDELEAAGTSSSHGQDRSEGPPQSVGDPSGFDQSTQAVGAFDVEKDGHTLASAGNLPSNTSPLVNILDTEQHSDISHSQNQSMHTAGGQLPELHPLPDVSPSRQPHVLISQLSSGIPYCTPASHLALPMLGFSTQDAPVSITIADAIQQLPDYEEAEIKTSWYLKSIAWYCAPMSVEDTVKLVNDVYHIRETGQLDILDIDQEYHKVAVVFVILALGTLMDMELQPHSPEAKAYCSIAQHCLGSGHHVSRHTPYALQALVSGHMRKAKSQSSTSSP